MHQATSTSPITAGPRSPSTRRVSSCRALPRRAAPTVSRSRPPIQRHRFNQVYSLTVQGGLPGPHSQLGDCRQRPGRPVLDRPLIGRHRGQLQHLSRSQRQRSRHRHGVEQFDHKLHGQRRNATTYGYAAPANGTTYPSQVYAVNASGSTASNELSATPIVSLAITSPAVASPWTAGSAYAPVTFTASNGTPPYTFSLSPQLPSSSGFKIGTSSNNGTFSATNPVAGTYSNFYVTVTDNTGATANTSNYTLIVNPAATLTASPLPNASVSTVYSQTISVTSGGNRPSRWRWRQAALCRRACHSAVRLSCRPPLSAAGSVHPMPWHLTQQATFMSATKTQTRSRGFRQQARW